MSSCSLSSWQFLFLFSIFLFKRSFVLLSSRERCRKSEIYGVFGVSVSRLPLDALETQLERNLVSELPLYALSIRY